MSDFGGFLPERNSESLLRDLLADGTLQPSDALNLNIETSLITKQLSKKSLG